MATDLPTEVWLLIARYLPKSQLFELKSLNSFFLHCWMDLTWRKVKIDTEYPHQAVRSLSRMVDPFVKTRTKRLTVCLRHFTSPSPPSSSKLSKLTSILLSKVRSQPKTFQMALTHLLHSLPLMPHITSLNVELWHIPLALLPTLYQTIATSPMASTIQKLRLSGHMDMLASLGEYSAQRQGAESSFGNLTELNFELIPDDPSPATTKAQNSILSLAHFVLSLSPTLQLLRIWNWSTTLDLTLFFSCLSQPLPGSSVPLPNLKSLHLILPFNTSPKSFPESLHCFLLTHSNTLQHLQLRLKMSRMQLDPGMEEPLGTWLTSLVDKVAHDSDNEPTTKPSLFFPNLQTLDVYPSATSAGLSALLTLIKRTAPTLSSLTIRDRYLTRKEAIQVLDALTEHEPKVGCRAKVQQPTTRNLKSLRMNTTQLTVSFLDLLAHTLPQLRTLWLSVSEIVGSDQYSFQDLLHVDLLSCRKGYLAAWKLHELSIWQAGQEMDEVVRAVAGVVPSVVRIDHDEDEERGW